MELETTFFYIFILKVPPAASAGARRAISPATPVHHLESDVKCPWALWVSHQAQLALKSQVHHFLLLLNHSEGDEYSKIPNLSLFLLLVPQRLSVTVWRCPTPRDGHSNQTWNKVHYSLKYFLTCCLTFTRMLLHSYKLTSRAQHHSLSWLVRAGTLKLRA